MPDFLLFNAPYPLPDVSAIFTFIPIKWFTELRYGGFLLSLHDTYMTKHDNESETPVERPVHNCESALPLKWGFLAGQCNHIRGSTSDTQPACVDIAELFFTY